MKTWAAIRCKRSRTRDGAALQSRMRFFTGLFLASALCAAPSFTIEQVLSAPFPSDLVTNERGKIVWIQNASGVRNLWAAEAPAYQARCVTNYSADDGQEIVEPAISPDGNYIVFTRGEGQNAKGESPNPLHLVSGVEQMVLVVPFTGGAPKELGKGHLPAIAPDSKTVAFVLSGQVWRANLDGGGKAEQWIHARGNVKSLDWSPDGKFLAMTSARVNHAFIGVYSAEAKTLSFLDPSTDADMSPVWSPDSRQIAFIRQQVDLLELEFAPHRADPEPWSIRVADIATGKGRQIWKANPGPGSRFHEIAAEHQLQWADGNRIVFPWERTAWLQLYSVASSGGEPTPLSGARAVAPFEVEQVSLSPGRRIILYSSNESGIDRRHVWSLNLNTGARQRLTASNDLEWSPLPVGEDTAFIRATAQEPARVSVMTKSGVKDLAPQTVPHDFPASALVEPQPVIFPAADGLELHGQLFLPPGDAQTKHPAVIFFHGGSRRQMLLGWHYMFYYNQAYGFNQYLASKGYVVLSVNYRSGIGYGLDFREALNYGAAGASEYNDVLGAGLYLRSRGDVVPNKIGLWGGSYGGYLTALGLARASDLFAAGVDLHGVHEWNQEIENFIPSYEADKRMDVARLAFQSSPLAYVGTWKSPVLLIHGDDDRNVNFKQSILLAQALRKQGVPFEELIFPDEIHDFLVHADWLAAYHAAETFLDKYLTK